MLDIRIDVGYTNKINKIISQQNESKEMLQEDLESALSYIKCLEQQVKNTMNKA